MPAFREYVRYRRMVHAYAVDDEDVTHSFVGLRMEIGLHDTIGGAGVGNFSIR